MVLQVYVPNVLWLVISKYQPASPSKPQGGRHWDYGSVRKRDEGSLAIDFGKIHQKGKAGFFEFTPFFSGRHERTTRCSGATVAKSSGRMQRSLRTWLWKARTPGVSTDPENQASQALNQLLTSSDEDDKKKKKKKGQHADGCMLIMLIALDKSD